MVLVCVLGLDLSRLWMLGCWYGDQERQCLRGERVAVLLLALIEQEFAEECLLEGVLHTDAPCGRVVDQHQSGIIGCVD
jgi:hypothetical protein